MNIITRQVRGGVQARFSTDADFSKKGKSREAAIGNLLLAHRRRFGIEKVLWDKTDEWTRNYLAGKSNTKKIPCAHLNLKQLPKVSSKTEAMQLKIDDLEIPRVLKNALLSALADDGGFKWHAALTHLCSITKTELRQRQHALHRIGTKKMEQAEQILKHYDLSFAPEEESV